MILHDLTRGKYSELTRYWSSKENIREELESNGLLTGIEQFVNEYRPVGVDMSLFLDNLPVFLVETSMSNEYIPIPDNGCSIYVPEDKSLSNVSDFDVDEWLEQLEEDEETKKYPQGDPREWECLGHVIVDYLAVYIYAGNENVIPQRIFIWADKILKCTEELTKRNGDVEENSRALLNFVMRHEVMHALMDVNNYGIAPCPKFNYSNPVYRYVEEALANYMALMAFRSLCDNPYNDNSVQQSFVKCFVRNQPDGYVVGLDIYEMLEIAQKDTLPIDRFKSIASRWMYIKSHFCYDIARRLAKMWKKRLKAERHYEENCVDISDLIECRANGILSI